MFEEFIKRVLEGHTSQDDTEIYAYVSREITNDLVDQGLWTKACVEAGETGEKAKLTYIKLRVQQIKKTLRDAQSKQSKSKISSGLQTARDSFYASKIKKKIINLETLLSQKNSTLRENNAGLNKTLNAYDVADKKRSSTKKQIIYTFLLYLSASMIGYFTWAEGTDFEKISQSFATLGAVYLVFLFIQIINYYSNSDRSFQESIKKQRNESNALKEKIKNLEFEKQQLVNELNTLKG
ncbi:MAG: hypothetical protein ACQEXG_07660 [Pseudomonadota bacterium]